ncbi:hypothetical protein BST61_g1520 [Cercospora zeina]
MTEGPPRKRRRLLGKTVALIVGTDDNVHTLHVHRSLLTERGGFFTAALKKDWKEGQENKISLPEDCPTIVTTYTEWLYSHKIHTLHSDNPDHKKSLSLTQTEYLFIASLYLFAEKILDDGFANAVIDVFTKTLDLPDPDDGSHWEPNPAVIAAVYEVSMPSSPLRRLMVQTYVNADRKEWLSQKMRRRFEDFPEFLMDLLAVDPESKVVTGKLYKKRKEFYRKVE